MAKMNLAIRGISGNLGTKNGDSFTDDQHKSLRADYILANPPYNLKEYWKETLEGDGRWLFGTPDKKNANYAWLSIMYAKLAPQGKAAILMPNGATTSNTNDDKKLRTKMIEEGKVDAIIDLPDKMFSNTGISVQCWVLDRGKINTDVLFLNATGMGTMVTRKIREFTKEDIEKISSTYHSYKNGKGYKDVAGFCYKASVDVVKEKDYSLNPGRYVGVDESDKLSPEELKAELKKNAEELFELIKEGKELEEKVVKILKEEIK